MAYRDFTLTSVKKSFGLTEQPVNLFPQVATLPVSPWLEEILELSVKLAICSSSEKARSEFIIAPLLLDLEKRNAEQLAIFSGERLDVDEEHGLKGECDFILAKGPLSSTIQTPLLSLVEAKKNDIKEGLGQCIAQLLGAMLLNQKEGHPTEFMYGCVTTGEDWQFLKLEGQTVWMDTKRYYINEIGKLLWIFQHIISINEALS